jgi:hypothetical protein
MVDSYQGIASAMPYPPQKRVESPYGFGVLFGSGAGFFSFC